MKKILKSWKTFLTEQEYYGTHRPPSPEDGAPLYDLTQNGIYPDDVYSSKGRSWYGVGDGSDNAAWDKVYAARGKPNAFVTIWRAVPKGINRISSGDWVTIDKQYAIDHGERSLNGDYEILKMRVLAKRLFTDGNSILEWGFWQ